MKKLGVLLVSCLLVIGVVFGLVACNEDNSEESSLPGSAYEKVMFAFDGVESSFKEIKGSQASNGGSKIFAASAADAALATINGVYVAGDSQGDIIDGLEYDQPPMIQFQYLKAVLEKVGEGYSFGTKYYYDVTGTMYADLPGNEKKSSTDGDEYKYDYSFVFAIEMNIDENDLITADVSFDVKLTQGSVEYTTLWYVGIELDYDMTNLTPNYTMNMMTDEDEINIPSRSCYTLENDYVQVKDNKIEEWRKFCFETDRKPFKDADHPTFDSYIAEGISYSVDTTKWYKNGNLRKITQMNDTKKRTVANALFDLGLNPTDIGGGAFLNKQGVVHNAIKEVYDEISRIWGDDIVYDITIDEGANQSGGNHQSSGEGQPSGVQSIGIRKAGSPRDNWPDGQWIIKNVTFTELLTSEDAWLDENRDRNVMPAAYYFDKDGGDLGQINPNELNYSLIIDGEEISVERTDKIANVIIAKNIIANGASESFVIKVTFGDLSATFGSSVRVFGTALDDAYSVAGEEAEKEIRSLGFPLPEYSKITKIGQTEYNLYGVDWYDYRLEQLEREGFFYINSDGSMMAKPNNSDCLQVRYLDEDRVQLLLTENPFEEWQTDEIRTALNGVTNNFPMIKNGYCRFDRENGRLLKVTVYNVPGETKERFRLDITNNGWVFADKGDLQEVIRIVNENAGEYYELNFDEAEYDILTISFDYQTYTMKNMTYSVKGGEEKSFSYMGKGGDWNEASLHHYDYVSLSYGDTVTFYAKNFSPDSILLTYGSYGGNLEGNVFTAEEENIYKITYFDRNEEDDNDLRIEIAPVNGLYTYSVRLNIAATPNEPNAMEHPENITGEDKDVILNAFKNRFGTTILGDGESAVQVDFSGFIKISDQNDNYITITLYSGLKDIQQIREQVGSIIGDPQTGMDCYGISNWEVDRQ